MSKRTISWLLAISLILNVSTIATFCYYQWFKTGIDKKDEHSSRRHESLDKKLGLTEDQAVKVAALRESLFTEIKPLKNELRQKRVELFTMINQDSVSMSEIYPKLDQIMALETQIHRKATSNLLKHRAILTKEQQDLFLKMIKSRILNTDRKKSKYQRTKADSLKDK